MGTNLFISYILFKLLCLKCLLSYSLNLLIFSIKHVIVTIISYIFTLFVYTHNLYCFIDGYVVCAHH